jgi:hypothetical protein
MVKIIKSKRQDLIQNTQSGVEITLFSKIESSYFISSFPRFERHSFFNGIKIRNWQFVSTRWFADVRGKIKWLVVHLLPN